MDRRVCRFLSVGLLAAFLTLAVSAAAMARTWTDSQGRKIQAKFVRIHQGKVILDRGGKVLSMSYFRLSEEDQEYVRKQLEAKGQGHLIPTVDPEAQAEDASGQNPGMNPATPGPASPMPAPASPMPGFPPQPSSVPRMPSGQSGVSPQGSTYPGMSSPSSTTSSMPGSMPMPYSPSPPYGSTGTTPMPPGYNPAGTSSSGTPGPSTMPNYSPPYSSPGPSMPSAGSFPTPPTPPMPRMPRLPFSTTGSPGAEEYECGNCKRTVMNARVGQKCPHCGVLWEYEDLGNGQVKDASGNVRSKASIGTVGIGGGIIVAIAGLVWFLRWLAKSLS